jgi:hypothetical protein
MRRFLTIVAVLSYLSACSSTTNPTPSPSPGLSVATQRTEAQAAIAVAKGIETASEIDIVLNSLLHPERSHAAATCKNGVETTVVQVSPEQIKVTIDVFYDPHCTTLLRHAVLNVSLLSPKKVTIAGVSTVYDRSGKPAAYETLTNQTEAGPPAQSVTRASVSETRNGPAALKFGLSCTIGKTNTCGFAGVANAATLNQSFGFSAMLHNFVGSGATQDGAVAVGAYQGALGSIKLEAGKGDSWTISGGTAVASMLGSFTEDVNPKAFDVSGTLLLKDAVAGATDSASFGNHVGIANGRVAKTSTSKTFATFSADASGSGAIDYSDGSTGTIAFFVITS